MTIKIGVTATQKGATEAQLATFERLLRSNLRPAELHHGDCIGGDEQAHNLAFPLGIRTVAHPPTNGKARAYCLADYSLKPRPYLDRNKDIVNAVDVLLAMPRLDQEERRSGTWSTVRYARQVKKPIGIIWPNGNVTLEF